MIDAKSTVRGVSVSGAAFIGTKAVYALLYLWIATLLNPIDLGIVTFGLGVYALFGPFRDFGLTPALIARVNLSDDTLSCAYSLRIVIALLLTAVGIAAAFLIPLAFPLAGLTPILLLVASTLFIEPIGFLSSAMLQREFEFKKMALADIAAAFAMTLGVVVSVAADMSLYAIFIGLALNAATRTALYIKFRPVRSRFSKYLRKEASMIRFGSKLVATGVVTYLLVNINVWVLGRVDVAALGLYGFAFLWASTPADIASASTSRVLLPTYSSLKTDQERIKRAYLRTLRYMAIISLAAFLALFIAVPIIIEAAYSSVWEEAIPILSILLVYGFMRTIAEPAGVVMLAFERSGRLLMASLACAMIAIVLAYPAAVSNGAIGSAIVLVIAYFVYLSVLWYFVAGTLGITWPVLVSSIVKPVVAAALALVANSLALFFFDGVADYVTSVVVIVPVFLVSLYVLAREDFMNSISYLKESTRMYQK